MNEESEKDFMFVADARSSTTADTTSTAVLGSVGSASFTAEDENEDEPSDPRVVGKWSVTRFTRTAMNIPKFLV
jgi:hypothetical protein